MILTISKRYANSFLKKYGWLIPSMVVAIGIAGFVATRPDHPTEPSKDSQPVTQMALSHALEPAVLVPNAAIWHPAGENALIFQPFDTEVKPLRYHWMEGTPHQWDMFPIAALADAAHLVWVNTDGKLWYSQINPDGTQRLLAINLVPSNVEAIAAARLPNGDLVILWRLTTRKLGITLMDARGRKITDQILVNNAALGDIVIDSGGQLYLAWTTTPQNGKHQLSVLPVEANQIGEIEPTQAIKFDLTTQVNEWLDTLRLVVDATWAYLIWGVNSTSQPEVTQFAYRSILKADLESDTPPPNTPSVPLVLYYDEVAVSLRWVGRVQNWDESSAQLSLTAYLNQQWTGVLLNFADGNLSSYETLSDLPANASPPTVLIAYGKRTAAWVRMDSDGHLIQEIIR